MPVAQARSSVAASIRSTGMASSSLARAPSSSRTFAFGLASPREPALPSRRCRIDASQFESLLAAAAAKRRSSASSLKRGVGG